ncbi:hypothetical protein OV079_43125 [Nannocystis pusilla]|uniref:Uncharacterized protein n=1 Tax=Nannocystis pusilla TaxID=889268 RepID=A0A9X3J214_9BACT|nr:hypothetical protein [Nannocystis pusilla]MCY1012221.1 hypothetical protein [Nannocystis pusilla]
MRAHPLPAAPALSPAPRTRPPPDVDPAALPACGKDMSQEPLAAICALSRPARDLAIGCAEPEEIMGVRVDQARLHQVGLSVPAAGAAADGDLLQTATEGEAPQPNTIVEPKPISGTVAAAEVSVVAADEAAGVALVAGWRAQLEMGLCRRRRAGAGVGRAAVRPLRGAARLPRRHRPRLREGDVSRRGRLLEADAMRTAASGRCR